MFLLLDDFNINLLQHKNSRTHVVKLTHNVRKENTNLYFTQKLNFDFFMSGDKIKLKY